MKAIYSLLGFAKIEADEENGRQLFNICMKYCIPYSDVNLDECGNVTMKLKYFDYKHLQKLADEYGVVLSKITFGGLPTIILRFKFRFGLMLGLLFATFLVIYFSSIIWDVRVEGNSSVTTKEILQILESHGITQGKKIAGIDVDKIQNQILIESDKISFIAINLAGNIANVEVRENRMPWSASSGLGFANIVAKKSGVIEEVRSYVGNVVVKSGQIVNKGDLLISGLYDSKTMGFRYTRAAGEVLAKTVEEYYVEIPLKFEKKQYTGVVNYEKYLNFFGKVFNISKKYRNNIYIYDTIYSVGNFSLFDDEGLPISISTVSYYEYEIVHADRSLEEAEKLAYLELDRQISSSGAEFLIKKTITPKVTDDAFILHCVVTCIENIAITNEFFVDLEN